MRILAINNIFPPGFIGGYELGVLDLVRGLAARGHDMRVLTSDYFLDDESAITDISVARDLQSEQPARVPAGGTGSAWRGAVLSNRNIRRIGSELLAFRPNAVVLFNVAGLGVLGILRFLQASGFAPVVYLMDDVFQQLGELPHDTDPFALLGGKSLLDQITFILMSRNLQREVEDRIGRTLQDATIIPGWSGIGLPRQEALAPAAAAAPRRFVFTSRIAPHKGIDIVLDAASRLMDSRCDTFRIDIFGAGETAWLLQTIAARNLGDFVKYNGVVPKAEMTARFADYDALLFPTWPREPFGFVVPEAAVAGCIPVMTSGIGAAEWFLDGIDSIKIHRDASFLAAAMLQIMLMPATDLAAMRGAARRTGRRFFRFDNALAKLEALLNRAADSTAPVSAARVRGAESALTLINDMWMPRHHE